MSAVGLMCFDMEGMQSITETVEEETLSNFEEEENLGPIIVCVDTSGSMHGTPETIAKAVTLFMASRAISQKRKCFLINFSTSIETLEISEDFGIVKVIEFLKNSFHGGTDVKPAFYQALGMMEQEDYRKSDLMIISDFLMDSQLPKTKRKRFPTPKRMTTNSIPCLSEGFF